MCVPVWGVHMSAGVSGAQSHWTTLELEPQVTEASARSSAKACVLLITDHLFSPWSLILGGCLF